MTRTMKYSDVKTSLEEMLNANVPIAEIETVLHNMIQENPSDSLKYRKAFFSLIKDSHVDIAIRYGEEVLKEEQDPKFMKVLAARYKRVGKKGKYQALVNTKIPLAELQQSIKHFVKNNDSFNTIEQYIKLFKSQHPELEESTNKVVFAKLKDIYTQDVLPYGEAVIAKDYDTKFIKVLATRYKRIGNQKRHDELLSMLT